MVSNKTWEEAKEEMSLILLDIVEKASNSLYGNNEKKNMVKTYALILEVPKSQASHWYHEFFTE